MTAASTATGLPPEPNWVDDGALSLGIASYALVEGDEALIYDTHVSVPYARLHPRRAWRPEACANLRSCSATGISTMSPAPPPSPIARSSPTGAPMQHLTRRKAAIEAGTHHGLPAIDPLILPTRLFDGQMQLTLGGREIQLIELNIHSDDATVIWLPDERILLAGDTLEDTVTYVGEPENFDRHLEDLERLWALDPAFILPNHGDPDIIAAGGYSKMLIRATQDYVRALQRAVHDPAMRSLSLRELDGAAARGRLDQIFRAL